MKQITWCKCDDVQGDNPACSIHSVGRARRVDDQILVLDAISVVRAELRQERAEGKALSRVKLDNLAHLYDVLNVEQIKQVIETKNVSTRRKIA